MKLFLFKIFRNRLPGLLLFVMAFVASVNSSQASFSQESPLGNRMVEAGAASIDITPQFPVRMSGYAARLSTEADSILQPIAAKALALGSDAQHPSVLITVDLVGIPWYITKSITDFLQKEKGIPPAQVAIYASHTHGGPEVGNLINILQYRDGNFSDSLLALPELIHIAQYTEWLTRQLQSVAISALNNRQPAYISWGQGQAHFAKNRRTQGGPVDPALPILKIAAPDGSLKAVFVNYACHGTTLGGDMHKIHGDWIAEAHRVIEERHPGTVALIALGAAGDANPMPRGSVNNVIQYGKEIADNVDKLLSAQLQPLNSPPIGRMEWVKLPFSKVPNVTELMEWTKEKSIKGYYARLALERVERGEVISPVLDYPVQVWNFDDRLAMVNLAGEVVVDYSIRLKNLFGAEQLWVNAYANDVPCYIASRRVIGEGGYEAEGSMYWYNKPAPFSPEVEDLIIAGVKALMPSTFKAERPTINQPTLILKNINNIYYLSSWLAGTAGNRIKYMPEWKALGWFEAKDQAIWNVDITKSGKYDVYLEWSVADTVAGKSFVLQAGNKQIRGKVEKTGSWFTYQSKKIGSLWLKEGKETVLLKSGSPTQEGYLFDVRAVRLIPSKTHKEFVTTF